MNITCNKCNISKNIRNFSKDRTRNTGLSIKCKQCHHEYYLEHKKHINDKSIKWYLEHIEEAAQYFLDNRDEKIEKFRKDYLKNVKKRKQRSLDYYYKHKIK